MASFARTKYLVFTVLGLVVLGVVGFMLWNYLAPAAPITLPGQRQGIGGKIGAPAGAPPGGAPSVGITGTTTLPQIPSVIEQKLLRLADFPVISPTLSKDETRALFYKKGGGDLFSAGIRGGAVEKIAHITVVGLTEALWPKQKDRAAVFYLGNETKKAFLHIGTSSIAILPQEIESFSWSPDGKSIAYLAPKDGALNMVIADSGGRGPKTVLATPILDAQISWISADKIAFQTTPSGMAEGFMFLWSRSTNAFTKILGPAFGLQSLWSPDGTRALISQTVRGGGGLTTGIYDSNKKEYRALDFITMAHKCAWADAKELYCAVPRQIPQGLILPDAYLSGEFRSSDRIVRVLADKNNAATVFDEGNFDMSDLAITQDKNTLIFVSRADGTLWSLKLK